MTTIKKVSEGFLVAGLTFLLFILLFENVLDIPGWLKVAGRMHPMFLHFPIVLLLLSFLSLWMPFQEEKIWRWLEGLRLVAALSAVITAIMGLILSLEDDRTGNLMQWHKWGGVTVALSAFVFYYLPAIVSNRKIASRAFTVFGTIAIIATGHWGAALTHGDNYLLAPIAKEKSVPFDQALVYRDVVRPVLQQKCVSCHSEENAKGGLLMDNIEGLIKGGKTGPLFVPGAPEMSLLIQRIHLPADAKKHMPPKSKPALSEDEAALLYSWIRSGALLDKKVALLPAQDSFRLLASRFLGSPGEASPDHQFDFSPAENKTISSLNNNYRSIEPLGMGSPALAVHFYGRSNFTSKALEELLPVDQQVTELSLARMPVKDDDLKTVSRFQNLETLNLNYTDITDNGLAHLASMKKLQHIALSGTQITSTALNALASLPRLSKIFIWDTPIDSTETKLLRRKYAKLDFETGFAASDQMLIALSPPVISRPSGVIDHDTIVTIKHPFKDVDIRYTLDGSPPDSVSGILYRAPVAINSDVKLTARAFKKGWYGSSPAQSTYIKRSVKPDSIELVTPPDPKYSLTDANLLSDGDLGELNFGNGKWLGYQKNEATFNVVFSRASLISRIMLNMLQNTRNSLFPAVKIEFWGGTDKNKLSLLGKIIPSMPEKEEPSKQLKTEITFTPAMLKYIRIKAYPLAALPGWHKSKGKPAWIFVSEIVIN